MRLILRAAPWLLLVACKKKVIVEDRYYSLVLEAAEERQPLPASQPGTRVALTEVTLPEFLMSRSLTLQVSTNEIAVARHHFWAEPLDESVRKVLIWDLSAQLPSLSITPDGAHSADCALTVEFDRLHATDDGRVLVSGRYAMTNGEHTSRREFDVSQPLWADGYTSAVKVTRSALSALSQEMGTTVQGCAPLADPLPDE